MYYLQDHVIIQKRKFFTPTLHVTFVILYKTLPRSPKLFVQWCYLSGTAVGGKVFDLKIVLLN